MADFKGERVAGKMEPQPIGKGVKKVKKVKHVKPFGK